MPYTHDTWDHREPVAGSWFGSIALHLGLCAAIVLSSMYLEGFHENRWGQISTGPTINATLVSSAPSLPLPNPQMTDNTVLATQTPSPAPLIPEKQMETLPEQTAIPIKARQEHVKKSQVERPKPPKHAQPQKEQHRVRSGEAAPSSIPMSTPSSQEKSVVVQNGDFGSRFGWYVGLIKRAVAQNWYSQLADPKASMGHSVIVTFVVHRDGSISDPRIAESSGVSSLDLSAIQAVERVGSIGPLPQGYAGSSISVAYKFTYDEGTRP